jgi:hypothetical protein
MKFIVFLLRSAGLVFLAIGVSEVFVILAGLQVTIGNYTLPWWSPWIIGSVAVFLGVGVWWISFMIKNDKVSKKY